MLIGLAALVALAAAVRSTWSPCGQSMLSQLTPVGEASRGYRYRTTAIWFVLGAVLGGVGDRRHVDRAARDRGGARRARRHRRRRRARVHAALLQAAGQRVLAQQ